jgi:hypothetical protein
LLRRVWHASLVFAPLAGAALLAALSVWGLWRTTGLRPPRTLIDRSTPALAPGCGLLTDAARIVPEHASFAVRTDPRNARLEDWYLRFGVGLLPGRRGVPGDEADFILVVGPRPREALGELVLETPDGTVWRRPRS